MTMLLRIHPNDIKLLAAEVARLLQQGNTAPDSSKQTYPKMRSAENTGPVQQVYKQHDSSKADRLLRAKELRERLKLSNSTFWRWVKKGRLPPGTVLPGGGSVKIWKWSEVEAHINAARN